MQMPKLAKKGIFWPFFLQILKSNSIPCNTCSRLPHEARTTCQLKNM